MRAWQHYTRQHGPLMSAGIGFNMFFSITGLLATGFSVAGLVLRGQPALLDRIIASVAESAPGLLKVNGGDGLVDPEGPPEPGRPRLDRRHRRRRHRGHLAGLDRRPPGGPARRHDAGPAEAQPGGPQTARRRNPAAARRRPRDQLRCVARVRHGGRLGDRAAPAGPGRGRAAGRADQDRRAAGC